MPVMDGIDATRNIRAYEREKRLAPVKVFAVTGIGSAAMQHEALMAGVDEYLVKPLSLGQLGKLMKVHL
jgi:CheY-like chemotaxis protein